MQTEVLKIIGLNNEAGVDKLSAALKAVKGVSDVSVSLAGSKATVQFNDDLTSKQELQTTISRAGFSVDDRSESGGHGHGHGGDSCCGSCS
ncbi:MAG TPA: heavy-metal-associated domain-containing protein [Burkholderiaceae bacterium]|nr:heavy-metal-associated domain-containing protein [Burkholderiaceae bacterium]